VEKIEKDVLWVIGVLAQLKEWGLVDGGDKKLTPPGESFFEHHEESWKPSAESIGVVLGGLGLSGDGFDAMSRLIINYRDDKQEMADWVKGRSGGTDEA